jgi:four helix bundle protein
MPHAPVIPASVPIPVPVPVRSYVEDSRLSDCERLDVFRVAVEFQVFAASVSAGRRMGSLRDQLDRASVSIVLNVAEGAGHFSPAVKANFYSIARGSAMECLGALTLLAARSLITPVAFRRGRSSVLRLVSMLTKLIASKRRA